MSDAAARMASLVEANRAYQTQKTALFQQVQQAVARTDFAAAYQSCLEINQLSDSFFALWGETLLELARQTGTEQQQREFDRDSQIGDLLMTSSVATQLGHWTEAKAALHRGLQLAGNSVSPYRAYLHQSLGSGFLNQSENAEALDHLRQAASDFTLLADWPNVAATAQMMSAAYEAQGDLENAIRQVDTALDLNHTHNLGEPGRARLQLRRLYLLTRTDTTGGARDRIRTESAAMRRTLPTDRAFQADVRQTAAEYFETIGELDDARDELADALVFATDNIPKRCSILMQLGRLEQDHDLNAAIKHAEQALSLAGPTSVTALIAQALQLLLNLRWQRNTAGDREQAARDLTQFQGLTDPQTLFNLLIGRALAEAKSKDYEAANHTLDQAITSAQNPPQAIQVWFARTAVHLRSGRHRQALDTADHTISLLDPQSEDLGARTSSSRLHATAAEIEGRLGNPRNAALRAEWSRAQNLNEPAAHNFDTLQSWLESESSAAIYFCTSDRGTFLVLLEPGREPATSFVDLPEAQIRKAMPDRRILDASRWNQSIARAIPAISAKLAPALQTLCSRNQFLYLLPDNALANFPFAALRFDDGSVLADRSATAILPSLGIAQLCRARSANQFQPTLFAASAGSVDSGANHRIDFNQQAAVVAGLPLWKTANTAPEAVTTLLAGEASKADVLFLACHGRLAAQVEEGLAASLLELGQRQQLTAKHIANLPGLSARLVFLNACTSGIYRSDLTTALGGFRQAFLKSGCASVIATLTYIDPTAAQNLALAFFENLLTRRLPQSEALRLAQIQIRDNGGEVLSWASHILTGSHT